eukprot:scaffold1875_cov253-Pinguiococcus_pyrenoidosus.AAC.6
MLHVEGQEGEQHGDIDALRDLHQERAQHLQLWQRTGLLQRQAARVGEECKRAATLQRTFGSPPASGAPRRSAWAISSSTAARQTPERRRVWRYGSGLACPRRLSRCPAYSPFCTGK